MQVAARRFAEDGYEKTRISDICTDMGVNAQLIYAHFPSKKHLFMACFAVYFEWMNSQVIAPIAESADSAARLAWRVWAGLGLQTLSRDLQAMARVEALHPESELRPLVRDVYEKMLAGSADELAADRKTGANAGLFDDELVAYGFLGVLENMYLRSTWDRRYTNEDILRNLVAMFLAVRAAYEGRVDLSEDWQALAGLVKDLGQRTPDVASFPRWVRRVGQAVPTQRACRALKRLSTCSCSTAISGSRRCLDLPIMPTRSFTGLGSLTGCVMVNRPFSHSQSGK